MPSQQRLTLKAPQALAFGFTDDRKMPKGNQDRVAMAYCLDTSHIGDPWFFAGVCDGVGGEAQGEVAASIALSEILSELCAEERIPDELLLSNAILRAHASVKERLRGSATTFAGVLVSARGTFSIGSVGDSRIYSSSEEEVVQLSQDDTLEDMLRRQTRYANTAHLYEALQGMQQKWKDSLGQAIGSDLPLEPRTKTWHHFPKQTGCILCTDGVWKTLELVLGQVVLASRDQQDLARRLLNLTESLGANDNATAVVLPDVAGIVEWLSSSHSPAEHGLVHIVLPTESIVAPRTMFEKRSTSSRGLRWSMFDEVPAPAKTLEKPKSRRRSVPAKTSRIEPDTGIQLTIEEETRDVQIESTGTVPKNQ